MGDDFYELKISEKVMFFVQLCLAILTLTLTIVNRPEDGDYEGAFYLTIGWNCIECLFCIGGILVFHFLKRPLVLLYLCLMFIHLLFRIVYVLFMLIQLHRATLHVALVTLSAILSLVQLWAALLLFRLLSDKNSHGYNTYM